MIRLMDLHEFKCFACIVSSVRHPVIDALMQLLPTNALIMECLELQRKMRKPSFGILMLFSLLVTTIGEHPY